MMKRFVILLFALLLVGCVSTLEEKLYPDVKVSRLVRVIDGDTFVCDIDEHSAIAGKSIGIRIRHINTPELRSRNPDERKFAYEEKARLEKLLSQAKNIQLKNLGRDKYFRIDADIFIDDEPLLPKLNPYYRLDKK